MGKAKVGAGGIEYIQGAIKRPIKKDGHTHGNYVIMTHRTAPTTSPGCQRFYVKNEDAYKRNTPVTPTELAVRNKFTAVSQAVSQRMNDPSTIAQDTAAFNAQKDQPGGKKTLRAYLWKVLGDVYDENQG
jgi:hypothetical protein